MHGGIWPLEEIRSAVVSVDFDRLVLDGIAAAAGAPAVVVGVGDDPADDVGTALAVPSPGRRPLRGTSGYLWTKVWARGACSKPKGRTPVVA